MTTNDNNITTTLGETFTYEDSHSMAYMVYRRFGRDIQAAAAAWRRMLQNSCPDEDFDQFVKDHETRMAAPMRRQVTKVLNPNR